MGAQLSSDWRNMFRRLEPIGHAALVVRSCGCSGAFRMKDFTCEHRARSTGIVLTTRRIAEAWEGMTNAARDRVMAIVENDGDPG